MTNRKRYALDIETEALPEYAHIEEAALIPHMSRITVVAVSDGRDFNRAFRDLNELEEWVMNERPRLVGHNFKFDLKHLAFQGLALAEFWSDDTQLMAHVCLEKVPEDYIEAYEARRSELNKEMKGNGHRRAKGLSLKVLAPYFLEVPAFWETPDNHDNDEYAIKDASYTARLCDLLEAKLIESGHHKFYSTKQLPWTKSLLKAELTGIMLNVDELIKRKKDCEQQVVTLESKLKEQWEPQVTQYETEQREALMSEYREMADTAVAKLKNKSKEEHTRNRYDVLAAKALHTIEPFNFDSPKQLTWLLKEQLGYDIRGWDGEEGTDKEVLQRLAMDGGAQDVATLLEYRKTRKLATTYYPTLLELVRPSTNKIHGTFEATGARTGRTSSNLPNLQNQPGVIRDLFVADPGHLLVTRDVSALEPALIAYFSEDPELVNVIRSGESFHSVNAKEIFGLDCTVDEVKKLYPKHRDAAKEAGLSVLYGAGANRMKQSLDKRGFSFSVSECKTFVERLRNKYAGVWQFKKDLDRALETGTCIYNYMGRPISFPNSEEVFMRGFNRLIQGSGSDIMQQALTDISAIPGCQVLLFVHDELVVQVPEAKAQELEAKIVHEMTKFDLGQVKLSVEGQTKSFWAK